MRVQEKQYFPLRVRNVVSVAFFIGIRLQTFGNLFKIYAYVFAALAEAFFFARALSVFHDRSLFLLTAARVYIRGADYLYYM